MKPIVNRKSKIVNYLLIAAMFLTVACNEDEVRVSGVTFENRELLLNVGESMTLNASIHPENATEKTIYWKSENPEYVTITTGGVITGVAVGNRVGIRVSTKDGEYDDWCYVTVNPIPVITINTHPAATTNVTVGSITDILSVSANVTQGAALSYQWYSNTTNSNTGGSTISGVTALSTNFTIPATLTAGTYYYFCEVRATGGASFVRSNVATVNVQSATSIEMVSVQGGTFTMGSPEGVGYDEERPQHQVTLSNFSIGKYEITQAQWVAVMGSNPSYFKGVNLPVETVSWNDIVGTSGTSEVINGITYYENGFIYKLNKLTGKRYRLPTEAEWEYAARGGAKSEGYKYSGSNTIDDVAWYNGNTTPSGAKPVGTKDPNELDIYDMSGNVFEWCSDWYGETYYSESPQNNPLGPAGGSYRVLRGGDWYYVATFCRVAYRSINTPDSRSYSIGFRLVLSL